MWDIMNVAVYNMSAKEYYSTSVWRIGLATRQRKSSDGTKMIDGRAIEQSIGSQNGQVTQIEGGDSLYTGTRR